MACPPHPPPLGDDTWQVHIYRLVSESTVEENILRKANQKRLLDSVVIQSGQFTTDFFKGNAIKDLFDDSVEVGGRDAPAGDGAPAAPPPSEPSPGDKSKGKKPARGKKGKAAAAAEEAAAAEAAAAAAPSDGAGGSSADPTAEEYEAALMMAEDGEDREYLMRERRMVDADAAEFDESVPFHEGTDEVKEGGGTDTEGGGARGGATDTGAGDTGAETDLEGGGASRRRVSEAGGSSGLAQPQAMDAEDANEMGMEIGSGGNDEAEMLQSIEAALTPVQRYMMRFLEESRHLETEEQARHLPRSPHNPSMTSADPR